MGCETIHETIIRDIIDIVGDIKNSKEIKDLFGKKNPHSFSSLAKASSNLTLVFPVIASKNLSIGTVSMVSKAIERKAVTMLQMLFSAISISNAENAIDYIKQFHTNLAMDNDISIDSFIDAMDSLTSKTESCIRINNMQIYEAAKKDLRNINYTLPDSISESSLQEFKVVSNTYSGKPMIMRESKKQNTNDTKLNTAKYLKDGVDYAKSKQDVIKNSLLDSDVKKANELVPTMMVINFMTKDSNTPAPIQAVIGVKSKIYPVDSSDMINRVVLKYDDQNELLKLIKATTREISFCRDFLFAIDRAKLDALSQAKKGSSSQLWKLLERRALKSRVKRRLNKVNDASAISTLVMSSEEVEYLKKNNNINIENPKAASKIMEAYNLMGLCIVDESMETAEFMFDTGDHIFETVPFNQLERENTNNEYKKIVNLMTKVSR